MLSIKKKEKMNIQTSNSSVSFTIKKLLFLTVKGTFPKVKGTIDLNDESPKDSNIHIAISLSGLDTNNKKRNEHLQQEDFFNAEKYPEISFKSSEVVKKNEFYWAKGELSIAGTTNSIDIPFQLNNNHATGEFSLDRMDYKVGKIPAFVAAKMVNITFNIELA